MNSVLAAAVAILAPYLTTSQAVQVGLTDKQQAIALFRPMNENVEKEAEALIETLQRLDKICKDRSLSKTQTIRMGIKGLVDASSIELPHGLFVPIAGMESTQAGVPAVPVTMSLIFSSKSGQQVSKAKVMLVFGRFRDGWHLADIEMIE